MRSAQRRFWLTWVAANAGGECIGLGVAGILGAALVDRLDGLAFAAVLVALGTLEGLIVGAAQWVVLRHPLESLRARAWIGATAAGAFIAWVIGMAPSTLMEMSGPPPGATAALDFSGPLVYVMAALMGAVVGPVLGGVQWLVLRQHVDRAWRWMLANAAAWALGMPIVFIGASSAPEGATMLEIALLVLTTITAAGAIVGAVHGLFLLRLLPYFGEYSAT